MEKISRALEALAGIVILGAIAAFLISLGVDVIKYAEGDIIGISLGVALFGLAGLMVVWVIMIIFNAD